MPLPSLREQAPRIHWLALLGLSALWVALLELAHLPAAFMLGPLAAAVMVSGIEGTVRVPNWLFLMAEALIGCVIARVLKVSLWLEIGHAWPLFLAGVSAVLLASCVLGWLLMRWRVLPGTTTIWGSFPGAALAMILMSEAYGEDVRLVAFMQYLRVVCVAAVASIVGRFALGGLAPAATHFFPGVVWTAFAETLAIAGLGAWLGPKLRIPAGALLLPMLLAAFLQGVGVLTIELPPWILAASYALIGWSIGARFTRDILAHAARSLPRVLLSVLALIAICGGIGYALAMLAAIDPLTAYLATSPGGVDSIVIIAANSKVDLPFVVAMQTARFLLILLVGPALARCLARRAHPGTAAVRRPDRA